MHYSKENFIHPTAILDGEIQLGIGNYIGPYCHISGPVVIGDNNWIGSNVRIGAIPEIRTINHFEHANSKNAVGINIGNNVVIRESAQIHQGFEKTTVIGSGCFIMNQVYIAHDCLVQENSTLASSVLLAGNVNVGVMANVGLGAVVHQGRTIGPLAMIGMSSVITRNIPPFSKSFGSPAKFMGVNLIGMQRAGMDAEQIDTVSEILSSESDFFEIQRKLRKELPIELCKKLNF